MVELRKLTSIKLSPHNDWKGSNGEKKKIHTNGQTGQDYPVPAPTEPSSPLTPRTTPPGEDAPVGPARPVRPEPKPHQPAPDESNLPPAQPDIEFPWKESEEEKNQRKQEEKEKKK